MSDQQDADNKQLSVQPNESILVNAQGEAKVANAQSTHASDHHSSATAEQTKKTNDMTQQHTTSVAATPVVVKSGLTKGIATGALILSILALGASGFLFVEGQNQLKLQQLKYDEKIDAAGLGASKTAGTVQASLARIDYLTRQLQLIQQQQNEQDGQLTKLQAVYQQLIKNRTDWLVDETEATLNMAAQQLIIVGNVPMAVSVLEDLDSRLARFDQPQLLLIKKAINSDLNDLKSKPYVDIASASLRLNRLETAVTSLPLIVDEQLQSGTKNGITENNSHLNWWQRAWYHTLHALQGMVEVRHVHPNDAMLISPQQIFFVRENLRLKLMDARLALMQRSGEVYSADLNNIEATVKQYFDGQSATTESWLKELTQLKSLNVQISQDANFLTTSLAAVRQYQKQSGMDMSSALPDLGTGNSASGSATALTASEPEEAKPASEPTKTTTSTPQFSIQAMRSDSLFYPSWRV